MLTGSPDQWAVKFRDCSGGRIGVRRRFESTLRSYFIILGVVLNYPLSYQNESLKKA